MDTVDGETEKNSEVWVGKVCGTNQIVHIAVPEGWTVDRNSHCIAPSAFGDDLVNLLGPKKSDCSGCAAEIVSPLRQASDQDIVRFNENKKRCTDSLSWVKDAISRHGLDMKLVKIHLVFETERIVFFYTADRRVDFRALVRDLVNEYRIRVEMRQITPREEAGLLGGLGVCGRALCCAGVHESRSSVSVKMAKAQCLSINSQKISGVCGKLMCCLAYEYSGYQSKKDAKKKAAEESKTVQS